MVQQTWIKANQTHQLPCHHTGPFGKRLSNIGSQPQLPVEFNPRVHKSTILQPQEKISKCCTARNVQIETNNNYSTNSVLKRIWPLKSIHAPTSPTSRSHKIKSRISAAVIASHTFHKAPHPNTGSPPQSPVDLDSRVLKSTFPQPQEKNLECCSTKPPAVKHFYPCFMKTKVYQGNCCRHNNAFNSPLQTIGRKSHLRHTACQPPVDG